MSSERIMIVEDDKPIRESLIAHFEDCGFETEASPDAGTALNTLESARVDAVVVDLRLPDMSGEELIRRVHARWPHVVFTIFTGSMGYRVPDDLARLTGVSPRVFLKPLDDLDDLATEIRRLLQTGKRHDGNDHHPDH